MMGVGARRRSASERDGMPGCVACGFSRSHHGRDALLFLVHTARDSLVALAAQRAGRLEPSARSDRAMIKALTPKHRSTQELSAIALS